MLYKQNLNNNKIITSLMLINLVNISQKKITMKYNTTFIVIQMPCQKHTTN